MVKRPYTHYTVFVFLVKMILKTYLPNLGLSCAYFTSFLLWCLRMAFIGISFMHIFFLASDQIFNADMLSSTVQVKRLQWIVHLLYNCYGIIFKNSLSKGGKSDKNNSNRNSTRYYCMTYSASSIRTRKTINSPQAL